MARWWLHLPACLLTYLLTYLLTFPLTHSLTQFFTYLLTYSFTHCLLRCHRLRSMKHRSDRYACTNHPRPAASTCFNTADNTKRRLKASVPNATRLDLPRSSRCFSIRCVHIIHRCRRRGHGSSLQQHSHSIYTVDEWICYTKTGYRWRINGAGLDPYTLNHVQRDWVFIGSTFVPHCTASHIYRIEYSFIGMVSKLTNICTTHVQNTELFITNLFISR